jgi:hypothetical protein
MDRASAESFIVDDLPATEIRGEEAALRVVTQLSAFGSERAMNKLDRLGDLPGRAGVEREATLDVVKPLTPERLKERGHTRLPSGYRRGGIQLNQWAVYQRQLCRKGKLAPERRRLIETIRGWPWAPQPGLLRGSLAIRTQNERPTAH